MLPMHFVFPHVLSKKANQKSTMGFTCHNNTISQYNLIKSRTAAAAAAATIPCDNATIPSCRYWRRRRSARRHRLISQLLRRHVRWQYKRQRTNADVRNGSEQQQCAQYDRSIVFGIGQKADRTPIADIVPGIGSDGDHVRWPCNELCTGAADCHRWRGSTCDRMPHMAMGRFTVCRRIETKSSVSERRGSSLCVLQSNALVSALSFRYFFCTDFFIFYSISSEQLSFA